MKPRFTRPLVTCLFIALTSAASAVDWYWDADADTTAATGGTGNWTQAGVLWRNASATGTLTAYNNATGPQNDSAANLVLAGGVDSLTMTLTASTAYNLNKITANNIYTFATNTATVTFVGSTPSVTVASGKSLVWGTDLAAASATVTKAGAGTWQWNNASGQVTSNSTTLDITAGTLQFNTSAASANLFTGTSGIVKTGSGSTLSINQTNSGGYTSVKDWTLGSKVILNGGTLYGGSSNGAQFQRLTSGTAIQVDAASSITQGSGNFSQNFTLEGAFTGSGGLTLNRAASNTRYLNLKGNMASYSGNVTIGTSTAAGGYVVFGHSSGWGSGTLSLSGAGSNVLIGDEAATAYNSGWTGGSALSYVSGTFAPGGAITVGAGAILQVMNNTASYAILCSPIAGITVNGGTLSANGSAGASAFVPATSSTWTFGGSALSTVSAKLQFNNPGATLQVADAIVGSTVDTLISGAVSGANGFAKTGAGTLGLSGTTTLGGAVTVTAGSVEFSGTTSKTLSGGLSGTGNIDVKGSGVVTLSGASAGFTGNITVADGAALAGEATTNANLTLGTTTGALLWPDFSTEPAAFTANNIILNGVNTVRFVSAPAPGTYTLLKYTGALSGTGTFSANFRGASVDMGLGSNDAIKLTIGTGAALIWNNGAANQTWDIATSTDWRNGAATDFYYDNDGVTFNDTPGSDQTINIAATVAPGSLSFSNSIGYTLSGSPISGLTNLVKGGTGITTLASPNTYSGGTTLNQGTLRVGDNAALSTGTLTLNGGTLSSNGVTARNISNSILLSGSPTLGNAIDTGVLTLSGAMTMNGNRSLTTASDVIVSTAISGAYALTKSGPATLTLTATNTYSSSTVNGGTLQVGTGSTAGSIPSAAVISAPGTLRFYQANGTSAITLAHSFSGTGTLALKGTGTASQSSYTLTGDNTGFSGTLAVENGARAQIDSATRLGNAAVIVNSGGGLYMTAGTLTNAFQISGIGWPETGNYGAIRVGGGSISGPITLAADARITGTGTISGSLTGTNALEINAPTLSYALTYSGNGSALTGTTTVSYGSLNLTGSLGGNLVVSTASGTGPATLSGEGSVAGSLTLGAVGKAANLTIDPNSPGALTSTGTLNVAETGSVVAVSFSNPPTAAGTFTVLNHGGTTVTPANFSLPGYRSASFDTATNPSTVTVTVAAGAVTWKGNLSAAWDVDSTATSGTLNWLNATPAADKFYHLDSVTFDDTATAFAPTLAVTVNPSAVTFSNSTNAYTLTGTGVIGGNGTLTKNGSNSLTLSTPNTFSGDVTINGGKLVLGNAGALGAAGSKTVTINAGGQLDFNDISPGTTRTYTYKIAGDGGGSGVLTDSLTVGVASSAGIQNLELLGNATVGGVGRFDLGRVGSTSGTINGNGYTLTKTGTNQVELRGATSNMPIIVNGGTVGAEDNDLAFGDASGSVTVNSGGTLATYGARNIATPVTLNTGSTLSNLGSAAGTWSGTLSTSGSLTVNPAGQTINLTGTVAGTATITVPAAGGTLNLSGTNTFTGGLIITHLTNNTATTVNLPTGTSLAVASGKPIQVGNTSGTGAYNAQTFNAAGAVTNDGSLFVGRSGFLNVNNGAVWTQNGAMTVAGQGGYTATMSVNAGSAFTYAGSSTIKINPGSGGFGYLYIDGMFTTSQGFETTVVGGTIYLVTLRNGGTLKLSSSITDLTNGATNKTQFALGSGGGIIDTNSHSASLSKGITGTGFGLTKAGAGTLTLGGTNSYTGTTEVAGGTLAGTGAAGSMVSVDAGATLAPGAGIGTYACAGATFASGSTLAIEINSSSATADKLAASGAVNISGASVSFADIGGGVIVAGTKLVLIDYSATTLNGTFSGYAEGASISLGSNTFTLSYADASKVTLTSTTVASPYDAWAMSKGLNGSPGHAAGFNDDPDKDGVPNGLEWILGGNPLVQDASTLLHATATAGGGLILTFNRAEESIGQASLLVESSSDLVSPWTTFATVEATSTGPEVVIDTTATPDAVTVTIPAANAIGGKLFARLKAIVP